MSYNQPQAFPQIEPPFCLPVFISFQAYLSVFHIGLYFICLWFLSLCFICQSNLSNLLLAFISCLSLKYLGIKCSNAFLKAFILLK